MCNLKSSHISTRGKIVVAKQKSIFSSISSLTVFLKFCLFTDGRQKRGKIDNFLVEDLERLFYVLVLSVVLDFILKSVPFYLKCL